MVTKMFTKMITAKIKYIWDRHHRVDSRSDKSGSIELRISLGSKKKYIATGISVQKHRWNDKEQIVQGILDAQAYNLTLAQMRAKVLEILSAMSKEGVIDLDAIPDMLKSKAHNMSFLDFIELRTYQKQKTKAHGTVQRYEVFYRKMKEWGKIKSFSDITQSNIMRMDEWLHGKGFTDETIYGYHKHLKQFINEAIVEGYIKENPYTTKRIQIKRGKPNIHNYVTEEELKRIEDIELDNDKMVKVRDLFVFQCYTGMAYADMQSFDFKAARQVSGVYVLDGKRQKTEVSYHFVLLDEAISVLKKYDWRLPRISNQKYNDYLKLLAQKCEIDKQVTSHYGRRTAGMIMLNNGVPIGVVSRILGHASVRTTEKAYAFLLDKTIDDEMVRFAERMKNK